MTKIDPKELSMVPFDGKKLPVYFQYDKNETFLAEFYNEQAKRLGAESITYTYKIYYKEAMIAYFSYTLGGIKAAELGVKRKITPLSHPAIKLGMVLVTKPFRGRGIGTYILAKLIKIAIEARKSIPIRFIVVDATPDAEEFYVSRGFGILRKNESTINMYLDIDKILKIKDKLK